RGPLPPNPAELLASSRFQEVLKTLDGDYDFVLVDTPPLLAVTDPSVVAPCLDGVLLTIRLSKNVRPNAERGRDMLQALGAKILGVVVNGVGDRDAGRYGYGSYYTYGAAYYGSEGDESAGNGDAEGGAEGRPAPQGNGRREERPSWLRWFFNRR